MKNWKRLLPLFSIVTLVLLLNYCLSAWTKYFVLILALEMFFLGVVLFRKKEKISIVRSRDISIGKPYQYLRIEIFPTEKIVQERIGIALITAGALLGALFIYKWFIDRQLIFIKFSLAMLVLIWNIYIDEKRFKYRRGNKKGKSYRDFGWVGSRSLIFPCLVLVALIGGFVWQQEDVTGAKSDERDIRVAKLITKNVNEHLDEKIKSVNSGFLQ